MLNFEFDAAWLLLPANIYHEIRKKWSTKEYAVVKRYFKFWKLCLFFSVQNVVFFCLPLHSTHHVQNWFNNDSYNLVFTGRQTHAYCDILRTLWFYCHFSLKNSLTHPSSRRFNNSLRWSSRQTGQATQFPL